MGRATSAQARYKKLSPKNLGDATEELADLFEGPDLDDPEALIRPTMTERQRQTLHQLLLHLCDIGASCFEDIEGSCEDVDKLVHHNAAARNLIKRHLRKFFTETSEANRRAMWTSYWDAIKSPSPKDKVVTHAGPRAQMGAVALAKPDMTALRGEAPR